MGSGATTSNDSSGAAQHHHPHGRRPVRVRAFAIGPYRFRCSQRRLMDAILDCASILVEGFVYVIGPLLILLALGIIALLTYTFFSILLPMMHAKHAGNPYRTLILMLHCAWVLFVLVNVLFNYACCVVQKHTGPNYKQVVSELADATEFSYPQTADDLAAFRRSLQDRLVIRMQRRKARAAAAANNSNNDTNENSLKQRRTGATGSASGQRRGDATNASNSSTSQAVAPDQQQQPHPETNGNSSNIPRVRDWMLMGPFEWGYCANSNQPKPPRSHFDHVSKSLVLNLDHYCPWMFNASELFCYWVDNWKCFCTCILFRSLLLGSF